MRKGGLFPLLTAIVALSALSGCISSSDRLPAPPAGEDVERTPVQGRQAFRVEYREPHACEGGDPRVLLGGSSGEYPRLPEPTGFDALWVEITWTADDPAEERLGVEIVDVQPRTPPRTLQGTEAQSPVTFTIPVTEWEDAAGLVTIAAWPVQCADDLPAGVSLIDVELTAVYEAVDG